MASKQNIIYVYFKGKHLTISKSQYQYNHGQFLYFADLNLPQAFEVHFSNKDKGESKTQIGSDNLVEIPDEYFWNGALQIYAWIYLHSKTTDGETIYEVRIPLTKRAKPTDEEPLPVQQSTIDRAIAELNNAINITTENANKTDSDKNIVSNIKEDVITLKGEIDSTATTINQKAQETINASERAETSAQNAATSENKALNYSQQAEQSAQSALESKNIAQQKSEVATNASSEALGYRNEALEAKNQAVQAKQNIVDYRNETKEYRDETLNLKNNVQTLKNQIDETAEEIDETASIIRNNAESANRSASSANESASQASQSANSANESKNQANTYKNEAKEYRDQAEEFKNQSEANVTHYPKIIDDYWYVWDATNEEYINTNVDANGIKGDTGNGIESIALNNDYTLTIAFTDGTSYTTSSIRGEKGDTGESGVYIGTDEPTNENIHVWIDTDDDGTSEDLVADIAKLQETDKKIFNTYATKSVSGDIVSFDDSAEGLPLKELTIDINPVQDLHGYDSPWVAGGGKNKFDISSAVVAVGYSGKYWANGKNHVTITKTETGFSSDTLNVSAGRAVCLGKLDAGEYIVSFVDNGTSGIGFFISSTTTDELSSDTGLDRDIVVASSTNMTSITFTADGSSFYWLSAYTAQSGTVYSVQNIMVRLSSVSDATYAPYENICPISGWTGVNIGKTGKNLLNADKYYGNYKQSDGSYLLTGDILTNIRIPLKAFIGKTVTLSATATIGATPTNLRARARVNGAWINGNTATNNSTSTIIVTATPVTDADYVYITFGSGGTGTVTLRNVQLEEGAAVTDYEQFGQTIPISWQSEAGTIYGGILDVLSGVLTVDRGMVDLGTLNWNRSDNNGVWSHYLFYTNIQTQTLQKNYMCSAYPIASLVNITQSPTDKAIYGLNTNTYIYIRDDDYATATDFKFAVTGQTLVYELAEPIEIQLTPHEVNSLLGQNNIFADTGDTSVEYFSQVDKDLIDYIETSLKPYAKEEKLNDYVSDVQVNGTSIVNDGVANVPVADAFNKYGVVKVSNYRGLQFEHGELCTLPANTTHIKSGVTGYAPIIPLNQHVSVFYGLAKSAGADEKDSTLAVGNYTDNAKDKIQTMLGVSPLIAPHESDPFESAHVIGELFIINGKLYRAKTALTAGEYINEGTNVEVVDVAEMLDGKVGDVQINGQSIVSDRVASIPLMDTHGTIGVAKTDSTFGTSIYGNRIMIAKASSEQIKNPSLSGSSYKPIVPTTQHESAFYGLASASGDTTQSASSNTVGTYTDEAKTAIKQMLGVHDTIDSFIEEVTGTDVTITGQPSYRYNCGEVYSLTVTPPSSGTIDFRFTSGSTPTVLTLPSTVKMPEWWVEVEANTIYEMCITDGIYCGVMSWAM